MRRRRLIPALALVLAAAVLWTGCGTHGGKEDGDYVLYFLDDSGGSHGAALKPEPWTPAEEEKSPDPGDLARALLAGPDQEGLRSPFPRGVSLQSWEWDEEKPGNVRLRLSEQYSGLTDISLTLADYAIVLTLAQAEGVESVEILSTGYSANYRSHQILNAEEAVLWDELAGEPLER